MSVKLFTVSGLLNVSEHAFGGFEQGDAVVTTRGMHGFVVPGESVAVALERFFDVGNAMTCDADGRWWPDTLRSLSVGDVALVGSGQEVRGFAVARSGWTKLSGPETQRMARLAAAAAHPSACGQAVAS